MVRTKHPRKTRSIRETTEESDSLVKDFERQTAQRIHKIEADLSMQISMLANSVDVALASLPTDIRKLTLDELLALDMPSVNSNGDAQLEATNESDGILSATRTIGRAKKPSRATAASDDGYATESTTARTTRVSRINGTIGGRQPRKHRSSSNNTNAQKRAVRVTRSASRERNSNLETDSNRDNKANLMKTTGRCPPSGKYKTPSTKNMAPSFGPVTPKIAPNTPMNIMRRPRQGEMVLSMQGSPLLVSSIVQENTANINVPLRNGNVISLLPNPGLRLSHMPPVDDETMRQLMILKGHIGKVTGTK